MSNYVQKLMILAITVATLQLAPAQAQESGDGNGRENYFQQIDTNGDGKISLDEYRTAAVGRAERQFKQADTNADGMLSQEELRASGEKLRQWMQQHEGQRRQ